MCSHYSVIGVAVYECRVDGLHLQGPSFALISDVIDGWAGLKGASSSPPPPLLLYLDNIMLCVHVHNSYWDRVFLGRGIFQKNVFSSDSFDISFFAFEGPLRLRRYEYEFVAECVPCGLF